LRLLTPLICLILSLATPIFAQESCAVQLVLAIDVSRSVSPPEFDLIRHGTAEAFRHKDVISLVSFANGGILVAVIQWSGRGQQRLMIPWKRLNDATSARALAHEIDTMTRAFSLDLTAPGDALIAAEALNRSAPVTCQRRVIDMSGDGIRNTGIGTARAADEVARKGVTINGLVIRGASPDPVMFYETNVRRGALSFVELAATYDDFPRAMFRKLIRELTPTVSSIPARKGQG